MAASSKGCWFLLLVCLSSAFGCGMVTHMIIADKARLHYKQATENVDYRKLLDKHEDAFLGGAPYPDSFYSPLCDGGAYHNISEDTHWTPFLNASINYINKQPKPWNDATEKLVVFIMGVTSHQVADVLWHSLGIDQGFLSTMGFVNFHGSYTKAHQAGDFGGDIVNMYSLDLIHFDLRENWYVPIDDLYEIYKEMYGTNVIDKTTIAGCSTLLFLTTIADFTDSAELFQEIADTSPFLVDNLQSYFLGGIDDMARWTFNKWHDVVNMLENGTSACSLPHNPLYINCTTHQKSLHRGRDREETNGYFIQPRLNGLTIKDLDIKEAYRGILIKPGSNLKQKINALRKSAKENQHKHKKYWNKEDKNRNLKVNYNVNVTETLLGWSLTKGDFDKDGNEDLVIGAPSYGEDENPYMGRVFIVYSSENGLPSDHLRYIYYYHTTNLNNLTFGFNRILSGPAMKQSRFGFSVAVLDLNQDGMLDLAVGAPSFSSDYPLSYNGAVFVYFGQGNSRLWTSPNITVTCQVKYCNLGYSLSTIDMNGDGHEDLIIGSPYWSRSKDFAQNGFITAVPSDKKYTGTMTIAVEKMKWGIIGDQPYGWFGHRIHSKDGALFVDQPYYRKCDNPTKFSANDTETIGRLHILNFGTKYHLPKKISIEGKHRFDMLGLASDIGDPFGNGSVVLAVGIPGAEVDAEILTVPWKLSQGGSVMLYQVDPDGSMTQIARYDGDRRFSRFGALVMFEDINEDGIDDLIISAPLRNDDLTKLFDLTISGIAYGFYGGKNFSLGNATISKQCETFSPCPGNKADAVFFNWNSDEKKSYYGDQSLVIRSRNQTQLVLSAPRNTDTGYEPYYFGSGKVYVFNLKWNI